MTAASGELSASSIIELIEAGRYPKEVLATIARGFLPMPQEDLIAVLAHVALVDDAEIAGFARASLAEIPPRALMDFASNSTVPVAHLSSLLRATSEGMLLEALIRNRAIPDELVAELATRADARTQEIIVINQARILRAPQILDSLLANPALTTDARRRALETKEEFFDKKSRAEQVLDDDETEVIELALEPIADLLEKAAENPEPEVLGVAMTESEKKNTDKSAVWTRVQFMSVAEKVQLAFKGNRMIRMLLVRERNRLVASAVMRNPRMTENEVESIAGMRNVEEDVLRLITTRRDWMSKYPIVIALVRNPKVPVGVVLPLINRLTLRDLKGLRDDKGVPQVVRETAKRIYLTRTQKNNG
jgi:hypothetical protein